MPARETIQLIHDTLQAELQATLDGLPVPAGETVPQIAAFLHPYADDSLEPAVQPAIVVAHGTPEPPSHFRAPVPPPETRDWSDVRVPVEVRYSANAADTAAARAEAGHALRAAYQVVRRAAGRALRRVRLVGITEPVEELLVHDGTRVRARLTLIAHVHEEML